MIDAPDEIVPCSWRGTRITEMTCLKTRRDRDGLLACKKANCPRSGLPLIAPPKPKPKKAVRTENQLYYDRHRAEFIARRTSQKAAKSPANPKRPRNESPSPQG